ncbi:IS3 family transposase [Actinacidiphila sp. ITFR-21]|uniref:IS3 family transposase n=1 Tax=Actinacidiphila sp. ITFR-21 TaxID=3075199 RepID=UPI0028893E99|nr:IS3 family transposase [Streptomyces sp. ITFR-21]WNI16203.1 IS3 family transposase [Streptomyces sp. ITFR-21]
MSRYGFIETMRPDTTEYAHPGEFMCERLDVSKSGYYEWRNRPESATVQRREELKLLTKKAFDMSDSTYGYRRVHAQLVRWGRPADRELVRLLMRELGLAPCQPSRSGGRSPRPQPATCRTLSAGTSPPTRPAKNSSAT